MAESFNGLLQVGAHLPPGTLEGAKRRRARHPRLHRLVQVPAPPWEITEDNSYITPAEFEATYYRQKQLAVEAVTQ